MIALLGPSSFVETVIVSRSPGRLTSAQWSGSLPQAFATLAAPKELADLNVRYRAYEMSWGNFHPPKGIGVGTFDSVAAFVLDNSEARRIDKKLTGRTEIIDGRTFRKFSARSEQPGPHYVRLDGNRLIVACMRTAARASLRTDRRSAFFDDIGQTDSFVMSRRTSEIGRKTLEGWMEVPGVRYVRARIVESGAPAELTVRSDGPEAGRGIAAMWKSIIGEPAKLVTTPGKDGTVITGRFPGKGPKDQGTALMLMLLSGVIVAF